MRALFYILVVNLLTLSNLIRAQEVPKPNLCAAVRGNGEVVFAHWPALAQIVEHYGPLDALSGGSSASFSIFLYESVSKNPFLSCPTNESKCLRKKSLEISLLLKSFQGYFDYWITTNEVNALRVVLTKTPELLEKLKFWKKKVEEVIEKDDFDKLSIWQQFWTLEDHVNTLLNSTDLVKVINPELLDFMRKAKDHIVWTDVFKPTILKSKVDLLKYRVKEAKDAFNLVVAGGFDAKNDQRLFFRPGLISFKDLAHKFGRMADFYAGYLYPENKTQLQKDHEKTYSVFMKDFLHSCADKAEGKSWTEFGYDNYANNELSFCGRKLRYFLKKYREQLIKDELEGVVRRHRVDDRVGEFSGAGSVGLFPSTSVLNKEESKRYREWNKKYYQTTDAKFGLDYSVPYESVSFGYWGSQRHLDFAKKSIKEGSFATDLKSQKLISLGQDRWFNVLSTSGAEPGLSPLRPIMGNKDELMSIGGWSDLHPTLMLKSVGCKHVVFITRINGETVFGQGVVKRLFNFKEPSWERIDPKGKEKTRRLNNSGDENDMTSKWSNLYNIANKNSSISKSISAADAVWCTDWDIFDIKKGYTSLLNHSYDSHFYINQQSKSYSFFSKSHSGLKAFDRKERLLTLDSHTYEKGWPSYSGCVPLP